MKHNDYFKDITLIKIFAIVAVFVLCLFFVGIFTARAEENKRLEINTAEMGWPTQIVYDSVQACYQGTYRWIVLSNPALIGIIPPPQQQRAMIQHCFCVLDRVRKQYKFVEYMKVAPNQEAIGNLYYETALKCVTENGTLRGIITLEPTSDNETKKDNKTITPKTTIPEEPQDSTEESLPGQPKEESNGLPETIFQG